MLGLARGAGRHKTKVHPKDIVKKWKIVTGDVVQIMRGKDAGKRGKVSKVLKKDNRMLIEGLNLVKKHVKPTETTKGGIITMESPVHYSRVSLVDPVTNEPSKIGFKFLEDGTKVRISRLSGAIIPKPVSDYVKKREERISLAKQNIGPKTTAPDAATKQTFTPPSLNDLD